MNLEFSVFVEVFFESRARQVVARGNRILCNEGINNIDITNNIINTCISMYYEIVKVYKILRIGSRILCIWMGLRSEEFSVLDPEFTKKDVFLQFLSKQNHFYRFVFLKINADSGSALETFAGSLPKVKHISKISIQRH